MRPEQNLLSADRRDLSVISAFCKVSIFFGSLSFDRSISKNGSDGTVIIDVTKARNMIKTKSIYKPKDDSDGTRILITRFYPRGVRKEHFDEWVRELAPSAELLKGYKEGTINQEQFTVQFFSQINSNIASLEALQSISEMAKKNNITLLCYERVAGIKIEGDNKWITLIQNASKIEVS